jgi:hypothetical protein
MLHILDLATKKQKFSAIAWRRNAAVMKLKYEHALPLISARRRPQWAWATQSDTRRQCRALP